MSIIKIKELQKYYGNFQALNGITLNVEKGQILGYLGPNGAGKTTTIKLILGLIKADNGLIEVLGSDPYSNNKINLQNRTRIGFMLEFNGLFQDLTGLENLVYWGGLYNIDKKIAYSRAKDLLELVELDKWGEEKVFKYSYGMTKRLALVRALIPEPELLILDEPTLGIDLESRHIIRNIIKNFASEGKAVLFSSHDLEEVRKISSHVTIIKEGKLIYNDTLDNLLKSYDESIEEIYLKLVKESDEYSIKNSYSKNEHSLEKYKISEGIK